jgi:hypothetical protein
MEDIDERYENGVIYMIKHKTDETKEYYIGSTKDFKARCCEHKSDCNNQNRKQYNYKLYKYIRENGSWNEWEIILLYDYPCKNRNELHLEEKRAVKEYKSTLNTQVPARTRKEYCEDNKELRLKYLKNNKETIAQQTKEYRKNNKEKLAQQKKEYQQNNKEKIAQKKKEYNQNNKEEIAKKQAMKINCDICNQLVRKSNLSTHKKSQKCKNHFK